MDKIILKNGNIIPLTPDQQQKIEAIIMVTPWSKLIVVPGHRAFKIQDMETDRERIQQAMQQTLGVETYPQEHKKDMRK